MFVHNSKIIRQNFKRMNLFRYQKCCFSKTKFFFSNLISHLKPLKILFYGTDQLSEVTLKALYNNRIVSSSIVKEIDVVCIPSDCAVRRCATTLQLLIHTWPYEVPPDTYDVGIVASFGHLIPTKSILACKYGMINAHPSLLPRWRGAAPIIYTILYGDEESGVTIVQVSPKKFDVGNIIMQEKFKVPTDYTAIDLRTHLAQLASELVLKTLSDLPNYLANSYPQLSEGVTYARKLNIDNGLVDWDVETAVSIYRKFKAYKEMLDLYTFWKHLKVILLNPITQSAVEEANIPSLILHRVLPGYCYFHKKRKILYIKCKDSWCGVSSLKLPKKGEVTAQEFYNGFISKQPLDKHYFHSCKNKDYL